MPKTKISEFSATPGNNTDIDGINIAEGCAPSGINDAIRELMAQLKDFQAGTAGDSFNGPVGTSTAAAGAFTTLSATGVTTVQAGTAGAPAITTTGDTNTGIFFPAADTVAASVGGTEGLRLTSTGLGIGTSSPGAKLHVSGTEVRLQGSASYYSFFDTAGTTRAGYIQNNAGALNFVGELAQPMVFYTSNTERMRLDSSGNLGLGVTPSAWNSSSRAIQIGSSGAPYFSISQLTTSTSDGYITWGGYLTGYRTFAYLTTGDAVSTYRQNGGVHAWFNAPSGTAGNAISFTQAMTLTAGGDLGIGATSPESILHVARASSGGLGAQFILDNTATSALNNAVEISFLTDGGASGSGTRNARIRAVNENAANGNANLQFWTWNGTTDAERARITSGGNLLVNRTSTDGSTVLQVATKSDYGIGVQSGVTTTQYVLEFRNANGVVGTVTTSGTATAYNTSSDYRLKDNQQPLTGSGAFIDALQPKTWNWKTDGSRGVGFIAHEVQAVSPGSVVGEKDGEQMQAMEYGSAEFIANIIAELQSLRARVAALESN